MTQHSLMVAPWGNPFGWSQVKYSFQGEELESKTSLEPLVKKQRPRKILIIVADTLGPGLARTEYGSVMPDDPEGYDYYRRRVAMAVEAWIKRETRELSRYLAWGRLKVEVIGGVGIYGGWRFGVPEDPKSQVRPLDWVMAQIMHAILRELLDCDYKGLEVDLTHGANYLPVMTREGAIWAARIYAAARRPDEFTIRFFQSDPIIKGGKCSHHIHLMKELILDAPEAAQECSLKLDSLLRSREFNPEKPRIFHNTAKGGCRSIVGRQLDQAVDKEMARLGAASARALFYNMPLAALYIARDAGEKRLINPLERLVERVEELVGKSWATVYPRNGRVEWRMMLDPEGLLANLAAAALLQYIISLPHWYSLDSLPKEGAPLCLLERVASHLGPLLEDVARNEIDHLEKACIERGERVTCFLDVGEESWPSQVAQDRARCVVDKRNCKAHAGITRGLAEARIVRGELFVRYRPNCWGELKKALYSENF